MFKPYPFYKKRLQLAFQRPTRPIHGNVFLKPLTLWCVAAKQSSLPDPSVGVVSGKVFELVSNTCDHNCFIRSIEGSAFCVKFIHV